MKVGYQGAFHRDDDNLFDIITNSQRMTYRFGAGINPLTGLSQGYGVANQVTFQAGPWTRKVRTGYGAFFAQDQWTMGRMTIQGAIRFDQAYSRFPEQIIPQDVLWPTTFTIPEAKGVDSYLDLSPRVGFAYDLFGNGKTSFKANVGRYLHPASNAGRFDAANPAARVVTLASRPWTDGNGNYRVDCDILNATVQDNRAAGGDLCGQGDPNYGRNRADDHARPIGAAKGGRPGRTTGSSACRCSTRSSPACRPRSGTTAGGGRSTTAPTRRTTSPSAPRSTASSA